MVDAAICGNGETYPASIRFVGLLRVFFPELKKQVNK